MSASGKMRKEPRQRDKDRVAKLLDALVNDEVSIIVIKQEAGKGGVYIKEYYTLKKADERLTLKLAGP